MSDLAHDLPDDDPNYDPTDQSSSQEYFEMGQGTLRPILKGYMPARCKKCKEVFLSNDLTVCSLCGTSEVVKLPVIHYARPCLEENRDKRYVRAARTNKLKGSCFNIPCQPDATDDTPKPSRLSPVLEYVTCPSCLRNMGVQLDEHGRLLV